MSIQIKNVKNNLRFFKFIKLPMAPVILPTAPAAPPTVCPNKLFTPNTKPSANSSGP